MSSTGNHTFKLDFAAFTVTATANGQTTPSLSSLSNSFITVGQDMNTAAWYNANSTAQAENFNAKNLGSISSPLYIGGEITTAPVLVGVTVKMFCQIDELAITEIPLVWISNNGTTSSKWQTAAGTDIFSGYTLAKGTAYKLKIWFNATDGTTTLWDSNNMANYVADFTYDITSAIDNQNSSLKLSGSNRNVKATFNGEAQVELFTLSGQLIRNAKVANEFSQAVSAGAYILRINGTAHKVLVK